MLKTIEVRKIAQARLMDANVLIAARRYDGAIYLCGYAVELALKARICQTLKWQGYPSTPSEFRDYQSFRTYDLDVLLHLTGHEQHIKMNFFAEWSVVAQWNPEVRYQPIGTAGETDAQLMISAATTLLKKI
ncbi:MAG: HEPN domain-containing protein [candidate division KSB1 bacterium]|nr:HEPN domain-containing protein [candidate division KSB1 bacterium]